MSENKDTAKKIVNLDYVTGLSKGNAKFVKEIIQIFLAENPTEIETLKKSIADENYPEIKVAAHKLRSTIPFVGLDKIIEKDVEEVEMLADEKRDINRIRELFQKISEMCEKACCELQPV